MVLYRLKQENTEANDASPADEIQAASSSPTLNANIDTRQTENPALYDTPGRSVAADMVRRFGEIEEMMQSDRHQGVDEGGDRSTDMSSGSTPR